MENLVYMCLFLSKIDYLKWREVTMGKVEVVEVVELSESVMVAWKVPEVTAE